MFAPPTIAVPPKAPPRMHHHLVRWVYIGLWLFLGLNITAGIIQAFLVSGGFPSVNDIMRTFIAQLALRYPLVATPLAGIIVGILIFGPIANRRIVRQERADFKAEIVEEIRAQEIVAPRTRPRAGAVA